MKLRSGRIVIYNFRTGSKCENGCHCELAALYVAVQKYFAKGDIIGFENALNWLVYTACGNRLLKDIGDSHLDEVIKKKIAEAHNKSPRKNNRFQQLYHMYSAQLLC